MTERNLATPVHTISIWAHTVPVAPVLDLERGVLRIITSRGSQKIRGIPAYDAGMPENHSYPVALSWQGSTGEGYGAYSREHHVAPAELAGMKLSADPHFGGDPAVTNPEHLLVMAASSCQLLSFLAVAARARLDVVDYVDAAEGTMPEGNSPMWITDITLHPVVSLAPGSRIDQLERLTRIAHQECFIANSLRSRISIDAHFVIDDEMVANVSL